MQNTIATIKSITNSKYLDIIGVVLVVGVSVYLEYYKTTYDFSFDGKNYSLTVTGGNGNSKSRLIGQ